MDYVWTISEYAVYLGRQVGGKNFALILCQAQSDHRVFIYFVHPEAQMPHNTFDESKKEAKIYVPAEQYSWYIDLLRNEEPITVGMYVDTPNLHTVQAMGEPPGEAE